MVPKLWLRNIAKLVTFETLSNSVHHFQISQAMPSHTMCAIFIKTQTKPDDQICHL